MARQPFTADAVTEAPWNDRRVASGAPGEYVVVGEPSRDGRETRGGGATDWSADQVGAVILLVFGAALFAFLLGMVFGG